MNSKNDADEMYSTMIFRHDCVVGLIKPPYREYPLNFTGLLHAADNVLIFSTKYHQVKKARECRQIVS